MVELCTGFIKKPYEMLRIIAEKYKNAVSTAVLEYAIELARTADTEGVVPAVAEKFNECLTNAEDLLARVQAGDASVTQDMVDESWGELMRIMQMLSFKQGDKTDLCKVIEAADTIDLDKYLEVGKDEFKEALEEAKAAAADENAMQDEVDQAWKRLVAAMGNLRLIPDKDLLEDLINQAQAIDTAEYTEESVAALNSALAKAIEVYNDDQADEAQVKEAETALKASMDQLVKNEDGSAGDGGTGDAGTGSDTGNGASGSTDDKNGNTVQNTGASQNVSRAVKTGDETNMVWLIAMMGFAAVLCVAAQRAGQRKH